MAVTAKALIHYQQNDLDLADHDIIDDGPLLLGISLAQQATKELPGPLKATTSSKSLAEGGVVAGATAPAAPAALPAAPATTPQPPKPKLPAPSNNMYAAGAPIIAKAMPKQAGPPVAPPAARHSQQHLDQPQYQDSVITKVQGDLLGLQADREGVPVSESAGARRASNGYSIGGAGRPPPAPTMPRSTSLSDRGALGGTGVGLLVKQSSSSRQPPMYEAAEAAHSAGSTWPPRPSSGSGAAGALPEVEPSGRRSMRGSGSGGVPTQVVVVQSHNGLKVTRRVSEQGVTTEPATFGDGQFALVDGRVAPMVSALGGVDEGASPTAGGAMCGLLPRTLSGRRTSSNDGSATNSPPLSFAMSTPSITAAAQAGSPAATLVPVASKRHWFGLGKARVQHLDTTANGATAAPAVVPKAKAKAPRSSVPGEGAEPEPRAPVQQRHASASVMAWS